MLKYKEFYRERGVRLVRDLLSPPVWHSNILQYPTRSMLIWLNGSVSNRIPSSEFEYFNNLNKPYVYSITEYIESATLGNPKYRLVNQSKVIKAAKSKEPKFKYIKVGKSVTVPAGSEVLFNLGSVNTGYRYISNPMSRYWVWYNSFLTGITLATSKSTGAIRHKFIFMDLPLDIPSLASFKKYANEISRTGLNEFRDNTYFNLMELYRFMDESNKDMSILANNIPVEDFSNIDLVLSVNNKSVIVNLAVLGGITDAHEVTSPLKSYPSKTAVKILYVFLKRILSSAAIVKRTENTGSVKVSGIIDDGLDKLIDTDNSEVTIDKIINDDLDDDELLSTPESLDEDITTEVLDNIVNNTKSKDASVDEDIASNAELNTGPELYDNANIISTLELLNNDNIITKKTASDLTEVLNEQLVKPSPYNDGSKLVDNLKYTDKELVISEEDSNITDSPSVFDKASSKDTLGALNKKYVRETRRKDNLSMLYSVQKAGLIIKDHEVVVTKSVLGELEEHIITTQMLTGGKSTIRIMLPVVNEDNTIRISGQNYVIRKQRADLPLKKISNSVVSLNSYYGKLFITRAGYKRNDLGYFFNKKLVEMNLTDDKLKDIASVSVSESGVTVPKHYGVISRYTKEFTYSNIRFNFSYSNRSSLLKDIDLTKIEGKGVLVGVKGKTPVIMRNDNILQVLDKDNTELGTIFEYVGIDLTKAPVEYCTVKLFKQQLPVVLLLMYYVGFTKLLKLLKVKYSVIETGKRVTLNSNQYKVVFKDLTYIADRDDGINDLIMYGVKDIAKCTKLVPVVTVESKARFSGMFAAMSLPVLYVNEIKLMENMFIDPITKQILEQYKQPTTFRGIIIKAVEMLQDDNYKHPNSLDGVIFKGYERISGMMYQELVKGLRIANNKSHFGKASVNIVPYSVINAINNDSSTVLVDDLNPIASLKQVEDVTYLGAGGRSEETMSEATRVMHKSEIGVISEAVKDSGAVGISAYLTASPRLASTRGTMGEPVKDADWSSLLSTSAMLAPFATTDDPKRTNFTNIMNAHVIPMRKMEVPYVRTGYESIVGIKAADKFVTSAIESGEVLSVSKNNIVVSYKDTGRKKYSLREWTSKEEAGISYTHKLVTNLKKGDKFKKDDTIVYDKTLFAVDIFDSSRVVYRSGSSLTVALMEAPESYEDSGAISRKTASNMSTTVTKIKSIVVSSTDTVINAVKVGDKLEPSSVLLSIADEHLDKVSNLDTKALEILSGFKMLSPKSKIRGTVSKVRVYYNCDVEELTDSIRELVTVSDKELLDTTGHTGRVNAGYSINGTPLQQGSVNIKYYIDVATVMGTGDKAILGNQLKFTVGNIYENKIITEGNEEVDCVFSSVSIEARVVNSPALIGTTSKLLEVLENKVVSEYFK